MALLLKKALQRDLQYSEKRERLWHEIRVSSVDSNVTARQLLCDFVRVVLIVATPVALSNLEVGSIQQPVLLFYSLVVSGLVFKYPTFVLAE